MSALTLAFSDLDDAGRKVRITTSAGGVEQAPSLTDELDAISAPTVAVESDASRASASDTAGSTAIIRVDGSPVPFEVVSRAHHWAAKADFDGDAVLIAASRVDPRDVELRRVADTEPYIRGWTEFQQAKWGLSREG